MSDTEIQLINIVLTVVVTVGAPILISLIGSWIKALADKAKFQLGGDKWNLLLDLASAVVSAAEQAGAGGLIENVGKAKKEWALSELARLAEAHGLKGIDFETLSTIIESAVKQYINYKK